MCTLSVKRYLVGYISIADFLGQLWACSVLHNVGDLIFYCLEGTFASHNIGKTCPPPPPPNTHTHTLVQPFVASCKGNIICYCPHNELWEGAGDKHTREITNLSSSRCSYCIFHSSIFLSVLLPILSHLLLYLSYHLDS